MNVRKFIERAEVAVKSRLKLPNPWRASSFLGRQVTVRAGTLAEPGAPDYDDAWLYECARHARTVFDVGANVGQSTLLMLVANAALHEVVLVEANWRALGIAAENLIRNGLSTRCRFVCAFAGAEADREVELWTIGTGAAGSMYKGHAVTAASAGQTMTVPTVTLDAMCADFAATPDLVKIDVEGAEHDVLQGARNLAGKHETRFFVEMHSPPELPMVRNTELVLEWCSDVGYHAWYLDQEARVSSPDQLARRGRCHLLLQPAGWDYPSWLVGIKQSQKLPAGSL